MMFELIHTRNGMEYHQTCIISNEIWMCVYLQVCLPFKLSSYLTEYLIDGLINNSYGPTDAYISFGFSNTNLLIISVSLPSSILKKYIHPNPNAYQHTYIHVGKYMHGIYL